MSNGEFDPQKIEDFLNRIKSSQGTWKFGAMIVGGFVLLAIISSTFYTIEPENNIPENSAVL